MKRRSFVAGVVLAGFTAFLGCKKPPPAPTSKLEVVLVDDETDWLAPLARAPTLPKNLRFKAENAPLGPGKVEPRTYATIEFEPSFETRAQTEERLRAHLAAVKLSPGLRFAFETMLEHEEPRGTTEEIGLRSYVIRDPPVLTNADIEDASIAPERDDFVGVAVSVKLTPEGARRFEEATGKNIKRRLAIVVDGKIASAPVVQARIPGGMVSISMGRGAPDQQKADAERLVKGLTGR